jgi:hypothetical protein
MVSASVSRSGGCLTRDRNVYHCCTFCIALCNVFSTRHALRHIVSLLPYSRISSVPRHRAIFPSRSQPEDRVQDLYTMWEHSLPDQQ